MASFKTKQQQAFEDLGITRHELDEIGEALKKEEFRKLFAEYIDEITDPENQKKFESEITELERERGNDVTFIHPMPGYVIKTSVDGEKKTFINICCNGNIQKPTTKSGAGGLHWSIPYTQSPPKEDLDKKNNLCLVFDVVFHPDAIQMAKGNKKFKELLTETALNAIEENFKVKLDRQNVRYPQIQFKGLKRPSVIRKKSKNPPLPSDSDEGSFELPNYPYPPINEDYNVKIKETVVSAPVRKDTYTTPKYNIKQRKNIDMQECTNSMTSKMNSAIPNELVVEIELPLIKSASDVTLDVTEKSLKLISEKPAKYKLDITLPYSVKENDGSAKFDNSIKKLTVTLVVKYTKHVQDIFQVPREDSGVDSDMGSCSRSTESSSEDEPIKDQDKVKSVENQDKPPEIQEENLCIKSDSDTSYRTKSKSDEFLSSDKHYSLPRYDFNVLENVLAFTFHVQNVEPDSIESKHLGNCGFHLKFTSIGSGYFPIYFSYCLKFPSGVCIDNENLDIEVWDNNVIAQVNVLNCDNEIYEYFFGVDEHSLERQTLPDPLKLLQTIQNKTEHSTCPPDSPKKIEVVKFEEDNVVFEITNGEPPAEADVNSSKQNEHEIPVGENLGAGKNDQESTAKENELRSKDVKGVIEEDQVSKQTVEEQKSNKDDKKDTGEKKMVRIVIDKNEKESKTKGGKGDFLQKSGKKREKLSQRSMSESHSEKSEPKPYRGILKVGRSLSESSADDYHWSSSSVDSSDPNAANVEKIKKTVRFSNLITKKTFRLNSSILDQKKKNQRKARSKKKRAQERRASESENSEGEPDESKYSKAGDIKSDNETSESQSDMSQSDVSQSDVSESDDGMKPVYKPDVMSLSKRNPHKRGGKKSARKSANTAKMDFSNNLMFNLDM